MDWYPVKKIYIPVNFPARNKTNIKKASVHCIGLDKIF